MISYRFKKNGLLWLGEYDGAVTLNGESLCEIYPHGKEPTVNWERVAEESRPSVRAEEKMAKRMINRMIEDGNVFCVKDIKTGEEMISLPKGNNQN